jgi:hypothetical protein
MPAWITSFATMKEQGIILPRGKIKVMSVVQTKPPTPIKQDCPDNPNPILTCEGKCNRLRPHTFVGIKVINRILRSWEWPSSWEDARDVIKVEQSGYVYKCGICGEERIWGIHD